jgi:4-hydroxymandelate oxidase
MPAAVPRQKRKRASRSVSPRVIPHVVAVADFEAIAKKRLSPMAWNYLSGGAADEITLRRNRTAFDTIRLRPRVLSDVSRIDSTLELLGVKMPFPVLLAPVGSQKMMHREGELATVRAAAASGVTVVASSFATTAIEDVARASTSPLWFQLYVHPDRGFTSELVARAVAGGCRALCLTVDTPVLGARNREARTGFRFPRGMCYENLRSLAGRAATPGHNESDKIAGIYSPGVDPSLSWSDLDWLRSLTKLPLVLKGVLSPADAKLAVERGLDGLIVSNHGGRNLDTVPATIEALPQVADAVAGRIPLLLDGGIRRGTDIIKALALGARAVLIGRPYAWGLAANGADGIIQVIDILHREFLAAMALCGATNLAQINSEILWAEDWTRS